MGIRARGRRGSEEVRDGGGVVYEQRTVRERPVQRHVGREQVADLGHCCVLREGRIGVDHGEHKRIPGEGAYVALERHHGTQCVFCQPFFVKRLAPRPRR